MIKKPIIQFTDFSFQYDSQAELTLTQINLTVYEGEKLLIVGPSGSGKSTLAHCINGLIPHYYNGEWTGSLLIQGQDTTELNMSTIAKTVGTVLQDPDAQFIGLTVGEDIAFKLENEAVPQAKMVEQVTGVASIVGMMEKLSASPHELSGGQKQRVTLAGTMVGDVEILLFDEPLANLDPYSGKKTIELIDQLHREHRKTVIIIEHRLEDVLHREVDRIIVMNEGRIVADLTPNELLCSDVLSQNRIREPLYLTALKYAGCTLQPEMCPEHIQRIDLRASIQHLHAWYDSVEVTAAQEIQRPLLQLDNVSFRYDREQSYVLQRVTATIAEGEMISIVGKNGSGKTTLSKLICGFHQPTSGSIRMNGQDLKHRTIKERAEQIGYVMQNPNQMISKHLIFDEVSLGLQIRGVPEQEIKERVEETLSICGLYPFRNWPISALSFGQKKRVTIASILVMRPSILILDEPTAGQDYRHYNEIMEFLLELNSRQGVTMLLITHDMHLMQEYTHRSIVLADGQMIADDHPAQILTDREVIEAAQLKETSVFELAQRAGFSNSTEFVRRFIDHDRKVRARCQD
jgi:energy-coupling factor transporter ATP-binding protein EcfA2